MVKLYGGKTAEGPKSIWTAIRRTPRTSSPTMCLKVISLELNIRHYFLTIMTQNDGHITFDHNIYCLFSRPKAASIKNF